MLKIRLLMIALGLVMLLPGFYHTLPISGAAGSEATVAVVKGNNAFALDLYQTVNQEKGNIFLSPYSISSALAMTYAGARGETAKQMEKTLHFDYAGNNLHSGFSMLNRMFNTSNKGYRIAVANALWGQRGTEFYPEFMEITKRYYDAGFRQVDYILDTESARTTINHWVEAKTEHKIVELIKPKILTPLTRLVLTNAIYFKGQWEWQFKPEQTKPAPFEVSGSEQPLVQFMHQLNKFKYAETDQLQLIELPYSSGQIVMDILLPKPQSNLKALESSLNPANWELWLSQLSERKVELYLPRFKMEKEFSLSSYLKNLGMKDAFDENLANFSGMSKTFLYITHVIHKAFVEVNEEGTEAAAATAVVMGTKSAVPDKAVFRADRPFLFVIRDSDSGSILFMGRMTDPR